MSREDSTRGGKASGRSGGGARKKPYARGNASFKKQKQAPKLSSNKDEMRLNKYVANSGKCSRREADIYITAGSVWVNGKPVTEMGYKVKLTDEVKFDGQIISPEKKEYVLLNKPKGFVTTTSPERTRTVMELVANASKSQLAPVGRLDRNTTGLLLFTNDDALLKKLTHHKSGVRKIYHVALDKNLRLEDFKKIEAGMKLEEGYVNVDEISYIENTSKREVGIQLQSNKNGILRKLFEHLNYDVLRLDRVIFGGLTKKDLPRGHWRILTEQEVINLRML